MKKRDATPSSLLRIPPQSIAARLLVVGLCALSLAACSTIPKTLTSDSEVCAAIKRSPQYSGNRLEQSMGRPFRTWVATTNETLDNLHCPGY